MYPVISSHRPDVAGFVAEFWSGKYPIVPFCCTLSWHIRRVWSNHCRSYFVRRSRAEITMARPKEPDMSPKRTKEVRLVIYQTQIWPSDNDVLSISGHWGDIAWHQDSYYGFWLVYCEFGCDKILWFTLLLEGGGRGIPIHKKVFVVPFRYRGPQRTCHILFYRSTEVKYRAIFHTRRVVILVTQSIP